MPITSPCVSISGPPELPRLIAASVWMASSMNAVWLVCTVRDRKSTRLNSSHGYISYVVFCLKKKRKQLPKSVTDTSEANESQPPQTIRSISGVLLEDILVERPAITNVPANHIQYHP